MDNYITHSSYTLHDIVSSFNVCRFYTLLHDTFCRGTFVQGYTKIQKYDNSELYKQYDNNRTTSLRDLYTVMRPGLSLVTSFEIRSLLSRRVCTRKLLLTNMGMFGDKNGTIGDKYSSGLSFVKLLTDTLVTRRHIASF